MKINIASIYNDRYGYAFLGKIAKEASVSFFDELNLDFSLCSFFEANMCAALDAVLSSILKKSIDIRLNSFKPDVQRILQKNKFLEYWDFPSIKDTNSTVLPFRRFKITEKKLFYSYLEQFMTGRGLPAMSELLKKKFIESLLEIFSNAAEHSHTSPEIFVCGQYFPNKSRLDFSIADAGVGFRENVRKRFQQDNISSVAAMKWVLQEGNTTRMDVAGGLGLKLLREFVKYNNGKLQIISRFAYHEYGGGNDSFEKMDYDFPGTCVNLEINTADTNSYRLKTEQKN